MKKKNVWKQATAVTLALGLGLSGSLVSYAGTWQQLEGGESWQWKYVEDNGSYTTNNWQQIDGKWYHFDADGYIDVGMREIDEKVYNLMESGAMEVNHDYGFGYIDENGVWTLKAPFENSEEHESLNNLAAQSCRAYGIDINKIITECSQNKEYTYSCSIENFPRDTEGTIVYKIVGYAISQAIVCFSNDMGIPTRFTYKGHTENGVFTITLTSTQDGNIMAP